MLGMNPYWLRSRTGWKTLPLELQLKVHRLLPVQDLKSAVLVNKDWNRVGEDPSLWSWVVVRVRSREDIAKLSVKRLAKIRQIKIAPDATFGTADWDLFFQNIEKLAQVKDIRGLGNQDLKAVDSGLLARALNGVENVKLWRNQLTVQQLTSIFNHIAVQETKIKKFELRCQDLKGVDSSLLARAVNRLEDVGLWGWHSELTSQQSSSIFHHIAEVNTKIKKLRIWELDLSGVPSDDLSLAVNKLECVDLSDTKLTTAQLTSIMQHIVEMETKIKILRLLCNDLYAVDGNLLNRARNKLSESGGIIYPNRR